MKVRSFALAITPVYRGLGYVVLDFDGELMDCGTTDTRRYNAQASIQRARDLLEKFAPKTLVLELIGAPSCRRKQRIRDLVAELALLADELGHGLAFYQRSDIWACLQLRDLSNKNDMAEAVALRLPATAPRLPKPRQIWESERHAMAMFVAAGLALAHHSREGLP